MCEETQADSIPFDILDKQICYYNEDNIEEELGRLLKLKLKHPIGEISSDLKIKGVKPLNIGKTTDLLKTVGKGEMISIIRQSSFKDLLELTETVMVTISHIETREEYEEFDGFNSFINLILKSEFKNDEYIKLFEIIFKKFLELNDYRIQKITEKIRDAIYNPIIKKWIIDTNAIGKLINIFNKSNSFFMAGINSRIIYPFIEELTKRQVVKVLENVIINDQIHDSFKAKNIIYAIVNRNRDKIPYDLWTRLLKLNLDENAHSMKKLLRENNIKINLKTLYLLFNSDDPWGSAYYIIDQKALISNFDGTITPKLINRIVEKEK